MAACCLLFAGATDVAVAQKAPEVGYVYPPGGQAGQAIKVQLGTYDWTEDMEAFTVNSPVTLSLNGPGSKMLIAEPPYWFGPKAKNIPAFRIPREFPATFTLPADLPPGPVFWQAANANGATKTGVFFVGRTTEITEKQHRLEPQRLTELPIVVNGRIMNIEEVDRYRFSLPKTTLVTCDLFTRRLGTPMHGVLEVHDAARNLIADAADTEGVDTSITFLAEAGRAYQVSLHDVDFRGNRAYVYRLALTTGPRVLATLPAVGRRGTKTDVRFIGIGLKTGTAAIESITHAVEFPADPDKKSIDLKLPVAGGKVASATIPLSNLPEQVAAFDAKGRCAISAPAAMTATFSDGRDEHGYTCRGKSGEHWRVTAEAWRFGSPLDLALSILDTTGKELVSNDDLPGTTDAGLDFAVPADGDYVIVITNTSLNVARPVTHYRLAIERQSPDFQLTIPQTAAIPLGGKFDLSVTVKRSGGFEGPVKLTIDGLPAGVTGPTEVVVAGDKKDGKISLQSDSTEAVHASLVTVKGESMIGEQAVSRLASATASGSSVPRIPADNRVSALLLAVTMKPRADVSTINAGVARAASRGTTYPAGIIVKRHEGYTGPVTVRMSAFQQRHRQGMAAEDVVVPAGVERSLFPCFLPEWLETNRTSRMRMVTIVQVPDPKGNVRELLFYQDSHVTLSLEGALLKVTHTADELTAVAGERLEIPVKILRSVRLPEIVRLELVVPESLRGSLNAEAVEIPVGSDHAVFSVFSRTDPRLRGMRSFKIRGTALEQGRFPAVSETTVEVLFAPADAEKP